MPLSRFIKTTAPFPPVVDWEGLPHAEAVTSIVYQIAPQADITLTSYNQLTLAFYPPYKDEPSMQKLRKEVFLPHSLILNWSGASSPLPQAAKIDTESMVGFFKERPHFADLLVKAVSNSALLGGEEDVFFNEDVLPPYAAQIILVGNLNEYGELRVKPFNALQASRFLCAYGYEVLVRADKTESGTSMAAPIIAGAAALLKSKYPELTLPQIGDVLLESAERTFWVKGWKPTFVYDAEEFPAGPAEFLHFPARVQLVPFDPLKYGKGVLNLRRAFLYADLKVKNPDLPSERLAALFKETIHAQETEAAKKIQQTFRTYRLKKRGS